MSVSAPSTTLALAPGLNALVVMVQGQHDVLVEMQKTKEVCMSHLSQTIAEQEVAFKSLKREVKQLKAKLAEQTALLEAERTKNKTLENSLHHHFSECKEGSSASFSGHYKLSQQQKMTE